MSDDRQLRDELEKVQSEVLRLKRALDQPDSLQADLRARVDSLRRTRAQQQEKLDEATARLHELDGQRRSQMTANQQLQSELDDLLRSERRLVDRTVQSLDPGPARSGCAAMLVLATVAGAWWWFA